MLGIVLNYKNAGPVYGAGKGDLQFGKGLELGIGVRCFGFVIQGLELVAYRV